MRRFIVEHQRKSFTERGERSRPGSVFERTRPDYIWKSLPRYDWSARVETRGIDWLGTTWSLAHTHKQSFRPFYYEVTDACILISGVHQFSRRFHYQWLTAVVQVPQNLPVTGRNSASLSSFISQSSAIDPLYKCEFLVEEQFFEEEVDQIVCYCLPCPLHTISTNLSGSGITGSEV